MSKNNIPGIVSIDVIPCRLLHQYITSRALAKLPCGITARGIPVKLEGKATLTWDWTKVGGLPIEASTLEFTSSTVLPEGEPLAFVITGASGKQFLIGTREPSYPVVTYTETTGSPDGEAAIRRYKVTHKGQKSVVSCKY